MRVKQLAQFPPTVVSPKTSVLEAAKLMADQNVGAAAVVDRKRLVGVISERDVMVRVVGAERDPATTKVREVMTRAVKTVTPDTDPDEAIAVMVANHIRHIVIVNESGGVVGLASARHLFQAHVQSLDDQVRSLAAFVGDDRHGG